MPEPALIAALAHGLSPLLQLLDPVAAVGLDSASQHGLPQVLPQGLGKALGKALSRALTVAEFAAILSFAISGLIEGARKQLDAVGVVVVAGLTAFGGGTLRDVLLDRRPFFWVEHASWLWLLLLMAAAAMVFLRARHFDLTERAMQWPDAIGLGLFTAGGTQIALDLQMPALVAVIMGVVTATFGGVLRDIVCNEIPSLFSDHRPYALCAFAGGWVVVGGSVLGWPDWATLAAAAGLTGGLRALVLLTGYRLPSWEV